MKKYLLLRDGREMGPFSSDELNNFEWRPHDLVWVVGESISWKYRDEVEELKAIDERRLREELISENETQGPKSAFNTVSLALVLLVLIVASAIYITHDWVQTTAKGKVAKKQVVLKEGLIIPEEAAASISNDFRNAITKEFVPAEDSVKAKPKPKDLKKLVSIENNDYKVGVLGGINKLKLTINNNSDVLLDEVTIQINYLKRNGAVVQKEIVSEKLIKPQSSKTIDIAPSKRGVKVSYKVLAVDAEGNKKIATREV